MKKVVLILISVFLLSCNGNNKNVYYYDTGEIYVIDSLVNEQDSLFYMRMFYKNGQLMQMGFVDKNGYRHGRFKEYYSDGAVKSNVIFDKKGQASNFNDKNFSFVDKKAYIDIHGLSIIPNKMPVVKRNQTYKVRVYVEDVENRLCLLTNDKFEELEKNLNDSDRFPYVFTPNEVGIMHIKILFPNKDGAILKSSDHFSFPISVVE